MCLETTKGKRDNMKVLVACEFSGRVRDAFIARGHDAISCDLLPSETPGPHIQGDIRGVDLSPFDLKIGFPDCTRLCRSGQRWIKERNLYTEQEEAIDFFMWFVEQKFNCIENPIGIMSTKYEKPTQYIQPYQHGHPTTKKTCLWLKGVPPLQPTNIVMPYLSEVHYMAPGPDRAKNRSRTYIGIATAMAHQWG